MPQRRICSFVYRALSPLPFAGRWSLFRWSLSLLPLPLPVAPFESAFVYAVHTHAHAHRLHHVLIYPLQQASIPAPAFAQQFPFPPISIVEPPLNAAFHPFDYLLHLARLP